ncbi:MAG: glycosyltransferase [Desulfuromonadales bacterium]|nr:glycosyltransferase [Desulfuromonadales bacterium]
MTSDYPIDIIIPVWNKPVELRNCLSGLVSNSPNARLIMVNNGAEREAEQVIEEFADVLDERALLISTPHNLGFVKACNLGLARSTAVCSMIAHDNISVTEGWLDPVIALMLEKQEAGIVFPVNLDKESKENRSEEKYKETFDGAFGAVAIKKELFDSIGGFDEELDGDKWALSDYLRRAEKNNFLVYKACSSHVKVPETLQLGSPLRREKQKLFSEKVYKERWGEQLLFAVLLTADETILNPDELRPFFIKSARLGHRIEILSDAKVFKKLAKEGWQTLHTSIQLKKLPTFFSYKNGIKALQGLTNSSGNILVIQGGLKLNGFPLIQLDDFYNLQIFQDS